MRLQKEKGLTVPARASLGFTLSGILAKGVAVLLTPVFSRLLTAEQYGLTSLYLTWLGIFSVLATLGISGSVLYRGMQKYRANVDAFCASAFSFASLFFCLTLFFYLLFRESVNRFTGLDTRLTLFLFMQIAANLSLSFFGARCRYFYRPLPYAVVTLGCDLFSAAGALLLIRFSPHPEMARILSTLAVSATFAVVLIVLRYLRGKCLARREHLAFLLPFSFSLFPHYAATILLAEGGRAVIGRQLGRAALAGYGIASALGLALSLFSVGIGSAYQPWVMRKVAAGEPEKIAPVTNRLAVLFTLLTALGTLLFPEIFSLLAPADYRSALVAALPLACSVLPHFLASVLTGILLTREKVGSVSAVTLATAVLSLLADAVVVPRFGATASGFVTLFAALLLLALRLVCVRREGIRGILSVQRTAGLLLFSLAFSGGVYLLFPYPAIRFLLFLLLAIPTLLFGKKVAATLKEERVRTAVEE